MKIIRYECGKSEYEQLSYTPINFGKINLIVGSSGTGKTRLLNTIFNGARMAVRPEKVFFGYWKVIFEHKSKEYCWEIETTKGDDDEKGEILNEILTREDTEGISEIINRDTNKFIFNGKDLPKLPSRQSSIQLLKDEDDIQPVYEAMSSIMRRNFSGSDLVDESSYQSLPQNILKKIKSDKNIFDLFNSGLNVSCKLYILENVFSERYEKIKREFLSIFPFVSEIGLSDASEYGFNHPGSMPIFSLKEKFSNTWFPIQQFSSGMKKVLLILSDINMLPDWGGVYMIDEYENSLGVNAINFFPESLYDSDSTSQFIITSHHPYIISNIPIKDWILLHRKNNSVRTMQGEELENRFGKSKQKSFIQLINDQYYNMGVS